MLTLEIEQAIARVVAFALNNANMQRQESVSSEIASLHPHRPRNGDVLGETPIIGEVFGSEEVEERREGL